MTDNRNSPPTSLPVSQPVHPVAADPDVTRALVSVYGEATLMFSERFEVPVTMADVLAAHGTCLVRGARVLMDNDPNFAPFTRTEMLRYLNKLRAALDEIEIPALTDEQKSQVN